MRLLAAALEWAIFLVLLPILFLHPRVRQGIRRRLGIYHGDVVGKPGPRVWLHGASAGDVLVLEYTELWPQLIRAASRAGVRLAMTNGRIAPENLVRYRLLFALAGNLLECFDVLMMRADDEAERALQLGAPRDRLHVTGNTKFDALAVSVPEAHDEELRAALGLRGERLWVCGSTHEGEEGPLLDAYAALRREFPDLRLGLAPRYVEGSGRVLAAPP